MRKLAGKKIIAGGGGGSSINPAPKRKKIDDLNILQGGADWTLPLQSMSQIIKMKKKEARNWTQ